MTARLEYVALSEVQTWPRNPKKHDIPGVISSIEHHGFVAPLILDEGTGRIVAGHGRLEGLMAMKSADHPVPVGIIADEHDWHVPVVRGITFANAEAAEAYLVADNRLTERGAWDREALVDMLTDIEQRGMLEAAAWTSDDLETLLTDLNQVPGFDGAPAFEGGHAETEDEAQDRVSGRVNAGQMREVVIVLPLDEHEAFMANVGALRAAWGVETTKAVVARAVAVAADMQR